MTGAKLTVICPVAPVTNTEATLILIDADTTVMLRYRYLKHCKTKYMLIANRSFLHVISSTPSSIRLDEASVCLQLVVVASVHADFSLNQLMGHFIQGAYRLELKSTSWLISAIDTSHLRSNQSAV